MGLLSLAHGDWLPLPHTSHNSWLAFSETGPACKAKSLFNPCDVAGGLRSKARRKLWRSSIRRPPRLARTKDQRLHALEEGATVALSHGASSSLTATFAAFKPQPAMRSLLHSIWLVGLPFSLLLVPFFAGALVYITQANQGTATQLVHQRTHLVLGL